MRVKISANAIYMHFRIRKDGRQGGAPCRPTPRQESSSVQVTKLDHSYMTPRRLWEKVKHYSKAVAKHSANAKLIDARVEGIRTADDNVVVTIKGENVMRMINQLPDPAQAPILTTKDGMPLIYTLSQIMTPALRNAEVRKEREKMAEDSLRTGDYTMAMFPVSAVSDVVMEVVIPPAGTEIMARKRKNQNLIQVKSYFFSKQGVAERNVWAYKLQQDHEYVAVKSPLLFTIEM
ncbi:hypothetical protein PoB_000513300 [Plakobranchus ocellatus]|uniref:Uncharacterized protein n=1 Tax=Plakobranchus ocellatus TaxID=259542 RepID=A0AAV3Y871_9GAST|nr:hypothetical protein PoB_000513300 [Plakobranchus ocellatus]